MSQDQDKSVKGVDPNNIYRTRQCLSSSICDQTFKNTLRGGDGKTIHNENRLAFVEPKARKRREQTSYIFSGEPENPDQKKPFVGTKYIPSKVMFNDGFVEQNPNINPRKKLRYDFERSVEQNAIYADELRICPQRRQCLQRKINDCFGSNPIKQMSPEETKQYELEKKMKSQRSSNAYKSYMGSQGIKGTFKSLKRDPYLNQVNEKIINDDIEITKTSKKLNEDQPYFPKRHFRVASCGGGAFTYM